MLVFPRFHKKKLADQLFLGRHVKHRMQVMFFLYGKILTSIFISFNFKNIFCTTFLKYKTAENKELALWYLVNMLVPKNI
jgi:hypothetical protein